MLRRGGCSMFSSAMAACYMLRGTGCSSTGILKQNVIAKCKSVIGIRNLFVSPLSCNVFSEPDGPKVTTQNVPGPKSLSLKKELSNLQNTVAVQLFINYSKSYGNYICDADDNIFLDVYNQISSMPLGYNHPALLDAMKNPANMVAFVNRPALGVLPPADFVDKLHASIMSVAPPGMKEIQTMACGSCSNENAFKAVCFWYKYKERGGNPPTEQELQSCMINKEPGCAPLSIMSFMGGFHGRTFGALATTHSKPIHKLDVPSFDWPIANFPRYKYPLEEFEKENNSEDAKSLAHVEELIEEYKKKGTPVAGLIVEPIQAEGGDNHASDNFFCKLRKICLDKNVAFICDEVQTGCGPTGKFWAHEHWGLDVPPDMVTFSKKMLTGGYFYREEFRPREPYRVFNTWLGDPSKMVLLEQVIKVIKEQNLLKNMEVTGAHLLKGIKELQGKYQNKIFNARGRGTFAALDFVDAEARDKTIKALHKQGIHCGGSGVKTLRIRTALIFQPKHADIFLDRLNQVLGEEF
ncbi:4-aminobutyrate aminotransferase, mitochondrial-like [Stegodyphus dumicola]|uniref:4-aminobutyrate aminotransferase, mitochondrial-like n=1 Tax=Stegodyphus dumicola TaxID=202533 RepID=UPI0015B07684|nr:4-aminobutyrate aminotransferase, mitochondrial-like [Stegodyphus dumicola]